MTPTHHLSKFLPNIYLTAVGPGPVPLWGGEMKPDMVELDLISKVFKTDCCVIRYAILPQCVIIWCCGARLLVCFVCLLFTLCMLLALFDPPWPLAPTNPNHPRSIWCSSTSTMSRIATNLCLGTHTWKKHCRVYSKRRTRAIAQTTTHRHPRMCIITQTCLSLTLQYMS
jgi:hypothetical protein